MKILINLIFFVIVGMAASAGNSTSSEEPSGEHKATNRVKITSEAGGLDSLTYTYYKIIGGDSIRFIVTIDFKAKSGKVMCLSDTSKPVWAIDDITLSAILYSADNAFIKNRDQLIYYTDSTKSSLTVFYESGQRYGVYLARKDKSVAKASGFPEVWYQDLMSILYSIYKLYVSVYY